jgi:hypothetical protein
MEFIINQSNIRSFQVHCGFLEHFSSEERRLIKQYQQRSASRASTASTELFELVLKAKISLAVNPFPY